MRTIYIIVLSVMLFSCKKSVEIENTGSVKYHVECDSCSIVFKNSNQNNTSLIVDDHFDYSMKVVTGDSVSINVFNVNPERC